MGGFWFSIFLLTKLPPEPNHPIPVAEDEVGVHVIY